MDKLDKGEASGELASEPLAPMETQETIDSPPAEVALTKPTTARCKPKKSVEGWIIFATGIPAEAESDDIERVFAEHGNIHSLHLNVDRRTGYLKGYALVEYDDYKSAQSAIHALHGSTILDQKIKVDWCFLDVRSDHRRDHT